MHRFLAALLFLLSACLHTYEPPPPAQPRDGTRVSASMGQTWDAVIDLFALRNIPIRTIERASGIIATEGLRVGPEGTLRAYCGKTGSEQYYPTTAIYNVLVRGDSMSSTVRTTVRWSHIDVDHNLDCTSNYTWELEFEHDVKTHAEAAPRYVASTHPSASMSGDGPIPAQPVQRSSAGASTPSPPGELADTPRGPGAVETDSQSLIRSNQELMRSASFRQAVSDVQRMKIVSGFQELRPDTLTVDLAEGAFTSASAGYNLGRLYIAYRGTTDYSREAALELRDGGQRVGLYSRVGLRWNR
jgi:hypothetical protein